MTASDKILVKGLALQDAGQHVTIDLELSVDVRNAARSGELTHTTCYAEVIEETRSVFAEAAADHLCEALFTRFPGIEEVKVAVHKAGGFVVVTKKRD